MIDSPPLGRLLLDAGILTQETLDALLDAQRTDKRRLGELVVERGLANPLQLAQLLARQMSCPWISLAHLEVAADVIALLPAEVAIERRAVPVYLRQRKDKRVLYVATDDPSDEVSLAYCAAAAGVPVRAMIALTSEILAAISRVYGVPLPEGGATEAREKAAPAARRPPPPPRPTSDEEAREMALDEADLEEVLETPPREARAPTVLTLAASEPFRAECEAAAAGLGARLVAGDVKDAADLVAEHRPCAIIVNDDVYAFDRPGLNRLALENEAHLVVWPEEIDRAQLTRLLEGAIDRWGRASYEKGTILDGRYEIMRDLGASAYGSLWEVRNVRTARRSVLALAQRDAGDAEIVAAIRRTHRALARILHPGAPALRDAGITELGDPYVVLEPVEGRTLDGLLAARGRLSPHEACAIARQLAEILSAAHGMGVLHNDVVGAKVLVSRDGYGVERVRLVGWEQATVNDRATLDARADTAAVAACLFEAAVGRRPRDGEAIEGGTLPPGVAELVRRGLGLSGAEPIEAMDALAQAIVAVDPRADARMHLLEARVEKRGASLPPRAAPADPSAAAPSPAPSPEGTATKPADPTAERRHPRGAYRTPVRIEVPGRGLVDGKSEDISVGGMLVVAKGELEAGTEVTIRFALPLDGKVIAEPAVVKWSRTPREGGAAGLRAIGVELADPSPETIRQVEKYVAIMGVGG